MGFPVGCTELMLPKFLLQIVFFLGQIRRFITWVFNAVGLGDLLLDSTPIDVRNTSIDAYRRAALNRHHERRPKSSKPFYALLIQDALPVVNYEGCSGDGESCAVCLHEFVSGEEVRQLSNCRHIFHKCCLDPWVELDQRTCPLCRTPLVPEEIKDEIDRKLRGSDANHADPSSSESYYYYDDYYGGGDLYDHESFGFLMPSQTEPFVWSSSPSAVTPVVPPLYLACTEDFLASLGASPASVMKEKCKWVKIGRPQIVGFNACYNVIVVCQNSDELLTV